MGVLVSTEQAMDHFSVDRFVSLLQNDKKRVAVLTVLNDYNKGQQDADCSVSMREVSALGVIESQAAQAFINTPFDYLYFIGEKMNPLTSNILAQCKAHCRVGTYAPENLPFFEMMILSSPGFTGLVDSFHRYTAQVR